MSFPFGEILTRMDFPYTLSGKRAMPRARGRRARGRRGPCDSSHSYLALASHTEIGRELNGNGILQ